MTDRCEHEWYRLGPDYAIEPSGDYRISSIGLRVCSNCHALAVSNGSFIEAVFLPQREDSPDGR